MKYTQQAQAVAILGLLSVVMHLVSKKTDPALILIAALATGLTMYQVTCLKDGKCDTFAWVVVVAFGLTQLAEPLAIRKSA